MPNLYKISDVKNPKTGFGTRAISIDSRITDIQRFVYTVQLAEQIFMQKKLEKSTNKITVWVKEPEIFISQKERIELFFTSFFEYEVTFEILKNETSPVTVQSHLSEPDFNLEFVCLFSGGLDSGTFAIENKNTHNGILHHTITHNIPFGKAKKLFSKHLSNSRLRFVHTRGNNKVTQPMYLKTRGLIFLTNLLAVAKQFRIPYAVIPENGPFMLNFPISPTAEPTRTTNPDMIREWTNIFNEILNSQISIKTPYEKLTKTEVIVRGNKDMIKDTWSCSYFQGLSKMCGMCNSCLVRILSCYAINEGEELEMRYMINPFIISPSKLKNNNKNAYRVSLDAINFWKCVIEPKLSRNSIEKQRFENINKNTVMKNHSYDMFLGFQNITQRYSSKEPLFKYFQKALKELDADKIKNRYSILETQMQKAGWK